MGGGELPETTVGSRGDRLLGDRSALRARFELHLWLTVQVRVLSRLPSPPTSRRCGAVLLLNPGTGLGVGRSIGTMAEEVSSPKPRWVTQFPDGDRSAAEAAVRAEGRRGVRVALGLGTLAVLGLALSLAIFGGVVIAMSTDSCPSELSPECASRVEAAVLANLALQAGAIGAAVWASRAPRLHVRQRFFALGGLALAQVAVTMTAVGWVTALW